MDYEKVLGYCNTQYFEMLAASRVVGFPESDLKPQHLLFGVKVNWGTGPNSYVLAPAEGGKRIGIWFSSRDLKIDPELLLIRTKSPGITEIVICSDSHHLGGTYYVHESLDTVVGMIDPRLLHKVSADEFAYLSFQYGEGARSWVDRETSSRAERIRMATPQWV